MCSLTYVTTESLNIIMHIVIILFQITQSYAIYLWGSVILNNVYNSFINDPPLLETSGIRAILKNFKILIPFILRFHGKCSFVNCGLAANEIYNMNMSDNNFFNINLLFDLVN
jgi:hypothetical protein